MRRLASLLVLALVLLPACRTSQPPTAPPTEIMAAEAFLDVRTDADVVLDVRTPEEYAAEHLEGALNIDVRADDFRDKVALLDRDETYFVYCRSGRRSARAIAIMQELGFEDVHNVGGLEMLKAAGAPTQQ